MYMRQGRNCACRVDSMAAVIRSKRRPGDAATLPFEDRYSISPGDAAKCSRVELAKGTINLCIVTEYYFELCKGFWGSFLKKHRYLLDTAGGTVARRFELPHPACCT